MSNLEDSVESSDSNAAALAIEDAPKSQTAEDGSVRRARDGGDQPLDLPGERLTTSAPTLFEEVPIPVGPAPSELNVAQADDIAHELWDVVSDVACAKHVIANKQLGLQRGIRFSPAAGWLLWHGADEGWKQVRNGIKLDRALLGHVQKELDDYAAELVEEAEQALGKARQAAEADTSNKDLERAESQARELLSLRKQQAVTLRSTRKAADVMTAVRAFSGVHAEADDIVAAPDTLPCPGSIVDLRTGEHRPYAMSDLDPKRTTVEPAPPGSSIKGTLWAKCLDDWTGGNEKMADYLGAFAGYCATGYSDAKTFLIAHGPRDAGKSQMLQVLAGVLGDFSRLCDPELLVSSRSSSREQQEKAVTLHGVRMAYVSEMAPSRTWSTENVTRLMGNDDLQGRHLYMEVFDFSPTHSIIIACNDVPTFRGVVSDAVMRRIAIMPFIHMIPESEQVEGLAQKLIDDEGPIILRWVIDHAVRLNTLGRNAALLDIPPEMAAAKATYRAESSPVEAWYAEWCVESRAASTPQSQLHKSLKAFMDNNGHRAISSQRLGKFLETKLPAVERGMRGEAGQMWDGVALRLPPEQTAANGSVPDELTKLTRDPKVATRDIENSVAKVSEPPSFSSFSSGLDLSEPNSAAQNGARSPQEVT